METKEISVLAVGAHPDDTDLGCSGTLAKFARQGLRAAVIDVTHAEMSSNGSVPIRGAEAKQAGQALGLTKRTSLHFPDRGLDGVRDRVIDELVTYIRMYRPRLVLAPDFEDRHPDHRAVASIVKEAVFNARLKRYMDGKQQPIHRVENLLFYYINGVSRADVVVDVTDVYDQKLQALASYPSQFVSLDNTIKTPLNSGIIDAVRGRDAIFGHQVGVPLAEGFRTDTPMLLGVAALLSEG